MNAHTWLEKAERLRASLSQMRDDLSVAGDDPTADAERRAIARWLQEEFSDTAWPDAVHADTHTLPLFAVSES